MCNNDIVCNCPAYSFPHRQGGGACGLPDYCDLRDTWFCSDDEDNECWFVDECPIIEREREFRYPGKHQPDPYGPDTVEEANL